MTKHVVDVDSLDDIIETAGMTSLYKTLDIVHMASLRDYVYTHLTYKDGEKPRTKADMIRTIVQIVKSTNENQKQHRLSQNNRAIDETTRNYATDALSECDKMKWELFKKCGGIRRYTKKCRTAKKRLTGSEWKQMEENIRRLSTCDDKCTESVVDAAGDIGNYLASCPGVTCYEAQRITGTMPEGACKRFRK
jgi:hypothetical protein